MREITRTQLSMIAAAVAFYLTQAILMALVLPVVFSICMLAAVLTGVIFWVIDRITEKPE